MFATASHNSSEQMMLVLDNGQNSSNSSYLTTHRSNPAPASHVFGPFDRMLDNMPLYGYPGLLFYLIHIPSLICLNPSSLVGITLILYLFLFGNHGRVTPGEQTGTQNTQETEIRAVASMASKSPPMRSAGVFFKKRIPFWKWNFGERLVVYLATADLGFSCFHTMDKTYYVSMEANPPDVFCSTIGFFFQEFMFAQWIIVVFTAINACSLVVFNKKLHPGRWDWRLILTAFGTPAVIGGIALPLGLLGQSGAWFVHDCYRLNRLFPS